MAVGQILSGARLTASPRGSPATCRASGSPSASPRSVRLDGWWSSPASGKRVFIYWGVIMVTINLNVRSTLSVTELVFNLAVDPTRRRRRRLPFSSTLVLPGLNIYEGLKHRRSRKGEGAGHHLSRPRPRSEGRDIRFRQPAESRFRGVLKLQGASIYIAQSFRARRSTEAATSGRVARRRATSGRVARWRAASGGALTGAELQGASLDMRSFRVRCSWGAASGASLGGAASGRVARWHATSGRVALSRAASGRVALCHQTFRARRSISCAASGRVARSVAELRGASLY